MEFNKAYNRQEFMKFLQNNFLPDDFTPTTEPVTFTTKMKYSSEAVKLGESNTLDLVVYEIKHTSHHDARVALSKEAFRMLADEMADRALVVFVPEDNCDNYRFSFIEISLDAPEGGSRITSSYSNPRRYSYFLGKDIPCHTPNKYLNEKGRVVNDEDLRSRFSVEVLTKEFYNELFNWFIWAIAPETGVSFPNNTDIQDDDREQIDTKIIRLITRLMFVWFIKQKDLVPDTIFDEQQLKNILLNFDPQSADNGNYYNAILQNLFFATLNCAINDEENQQRCFAKGKGKDLKTLYRYAELFSITETEVIQLFANVPFLNGGLFECLDKTNTIDGVEKAFNFDGFSRNDSTFADGKFRNRAFIPNQLFFEPEKGLLSILKRYNFTVEENMPFDQEVSLDPELLGKVFENLLGVYNPETKESARKSSGSFYTPREIVQYMVDESLIAYLGDTTITRNLFADNFVPDNKSMEIYPTIAQKLKSIKILDPACGSGAFPMGFLNRVVEILKRIGSEESDYKLKLNLIENSIYGVDIQPIATQISKLRFFISLICDCERDNAKPNFGIPTLPNLETKFACANTLIGKKKKESQLNLFENEEIAETQKELQVTRHKHFKARTAKEKIALRKQDEKLRNKLAQLLQENKEFAPDDANQLAAWNPYDQNAISPFFDSEWMFGVKEGFDIVIGNPPYIQLQNNGGALGKMYQKCGFETFASTGDIFSLFYERGWQLLKPNAHLCFITSNKWMRAGYGEATRRFFAEKTNPVQLIDFAGVRIFESATVDTNILLYQKAKNQNATLACITKGADCRNNLSAYVQQNASTCAFSNGDSWVILSPIEQSIKAKIEAVGTPLKNWDINIYRGVLTGCNEAFIISGEKRDEILANCKNEEEQQRTAELIRPILRGRDIKRYGYEFADLYLIATFPAKHYNIDDFPAIRDYLLSYGKERLEQTGMTYTVNGELIKARKKTNNKWFETQDSISYWVIFLELLHLKYI